MAIYSGSRYSRSRMRVRGSNMYLTLPTRVEFNFENCIMYQVKEGDTIDILSYKFYGNSAYWWCIMDANREFQSELEIKPGVILQIPKLKDIRNVVR